MKLNPMQFACVPETNATPSPSPSSHLDAALKAENDFFENVWDQGIKTPPSLLFGGRGGGDQAYDGCFALSHAILSLQAAH